MLARPAAGRCEGSLEWARVLAAPLSHIVLSLLIMSQHGPGNKDNLGTAAAIYFYMEIRSVCTASEASNYNVM